MNDKNSHNLGVEKIFLKIFTKCFAGYKKVPIFASQLRKTTYLIQAKKLIIGAFSSAGSEHLPYKQRVGGSNPSTPTPLNKQPVIHKMDTGFFMQQ